jgi:cytochrome d ubiquinol oxidase subunit I
MESVFLGLWIFGWDRLPKGIHLATIWAAAIGTLASAYFILAANSWMQHPVGYLIDDETGRAVLNDIGAVLFQDTAVVTFFHTMFASFMTAGAAVAAVAGYKMVKGRQINVFRPAVKSASIVMIVAAVGLSITGDMTSKIMVEQQPMKMAAAEGLYETESQAPFSILTIGEINGNSADCVLCVPGLLSFLATGSFDGEVQGINDIQAEYEQRFGAGVDYRPIVPVTYWSFRLMIGLGLLGALFGMWSLWRYRGDRTPNSNGRMGKFYVLAATTVVLAPLAANSAGWIFTEMSPLEVWISLIGFTVVYAVLAFIEVKLLLYYIRKGALERDELVEDPYADAVAAENSDDDDRTLYFAY